MPHPRFDAHTHLFAPEQVRLRDAICAHDAGFAELYADPRAKMALVADLDRALTRGAFDGAVAAGFAFAHERDIAAQNEYLLAAPSAGTHRIAPFVTVNPALPGWQRMLEDAATRGARGVGELRPGTQGWDPLGPDGHALGQAARDLGLILLWHVSEPVGHTYPGKTGGIGPIEMIRFAMAYPDVPMIAAHLGAGASFYLQMHEVSEMVPMLYFDTAAAFLLYDDDCVTRLAAMVGPDRVLFASDFPLQSPARHAVRVESSLQEHTISGILGGNASSLIFGFTNS